MICPCCGQPCCILVRTGKVGKTCGKELCKRHVQGLRPDHFAQMGRVGGKWDRQAKKKNAAGLLGSTASG